MTRNPYPEIPMPKFLVASALALVTRLASAHAGHGFADPHWHAGDLFGPVVTLGCAAAAFWLWRKNK